ncbi:unnamed protein product [Adineta ricciae]|uniref:Suppressor of white apricot N-terminal domain-containing protein n=1 Tax=Adineta ricciae TaxID=249248 RepID=A0A814DU01_ADIRI|nr:unnamed protein product [Adineta ricciae]
MWQEMRKHEKKLRGMIVDYKKRSERRKEYYERIKRDPAEFLQIWGRPAKIHLDPAVATAAESTLTPWRDDESTLIDRFDVRSHLDIIDEYSLRTQQGSELLTETEQNEERLCNYERYRVLIHNESTSVSEEQCLRDIENDEKFGALRDEHPASREAKKKKSIGKKAEIGFAYDDAPATTSSKKSILDDSDNDDDDDDDLDLDIEIDVAQLTSENKASLNKVATHYGLAFGDFARLLILDREEMQIIRENKLDREQDVPGKGRRGRRERRLAKERRIKEREFCPPNYLNRETPILPVVQAKSKSRSPSPVDNTPVKEKIEFITAFGEDDASKANELKRKRSFEKSLLDECREAKKKADPQVISIRTHRLATPPRLPEPTTTFVPCRTIQRKSQVLLSTLQKLKEDSSPERHALSDDEIPAIKIVKLDKKEENINSKKDNEDDDEEEDDDNYLQQYLKRKEARQRNQDSSATSVAHKEQNGSNPLSSSSSSSKSSMVKTPQEKLRRRMQTLLKKQFQKDKDQQREREEREEREREARESELRQSFGKHRHRRSHHRSSSRSRSRTRSRSRSPTPRRPPPHRRSTSRSSSSSTSSSSSSSSSSRHSSKNRNRKRPPVGKSRSPTPEFLRQRFRRNHRRRESSSSSTSSSSKSNRNSSGRKRTDHK